MKQAPYLGNLKVLCTFSAQLCSSIEDKLGADGCSAKNDIAERRKVIIIHHGMLVYEKYDGRSKIRALDTAWREAGT